MKHVFAIAAVLGLSGCTTLPNLPPQYGAKVTDVVRMLTCEIAMSRSFSLFQSEQSGWKAAADMNLKLLNTSEGSLGADTSSPIGSGLLATSGTIGRKAISKRDANFKFDISIQGTQTDECNRSPIDNTTEGLKGGLRVREWLGEVEGLKQLTGTRPYEMTYSVEFEVTQSLGFGPKISLIPIGKGNLGAGFGLAASNSNTNILTLTFTEVPIASKPAPTEVIILNFPGNSGKVAKGNLKTVPKKALGVDNDAARKALDNAIERKIQSEQKIINLPF